MEGRPSEVRGEAQRRCWIMIVVASLCLGCSHLQGLTPTLQQAPLPPWDTPKPINGSPCEYWSCATPNGGLRLVHRTWAGSSRGAPGTVQGNPKVPSGGVAQGVGHPTPLSLPVTRLSTSGAYLFSRSCCIWNAECSSKRCHHLLCRCVASCELSA